MNLTIYSDPDSFCVLSHDAGFEVVSVRGERRDERECHIFEIPDSTPNGHGCWIKFTKDGMVPINFRGILYRTGRAWVLVTDDLYLQSKREILDDFIHQIEAAAVKSLEIENKLIAVRDSIKL